MIAKIINFELWFIYDEYQDQEKIDEVNFQLIISDIKKAVDESYIDTIVGSLLVDGFLNRNNENYYNFLKKIYIYSLDLGIKNFFLLSGMCWDYQEELDKRNIPYKIIQFDTSVNHSYYSYKDNLDNLSNWNSNSSKFLFLTGVPSRPNRIGLLSKYYDLDMLKNSEWSFFPPWIDADKAWCRNYLNKYSDIEYEKFLNDCNRNIDGLYEECKNYSRLTGKELEDSKIFESDWCNNCAWIDPIIYSNTTLSIISEGGMNHQDYRFLTEKTWRAIINHHPFILADHPDRFKFLKDKGLCTFEDYMYIKDYGYIENEEERLDAVVENTRYFLNNYKKYKEDISKDVEYNYQKFLLEVSNNFKIINMLTDELGVSQQDINDYLLRPDFKAYIRIPKT